MQKTYTDLALILTWPDATIRGDERWMMFFKKIGIVKNLNFKVGHTGIVIVKRTTGEMRFYDFGRYISPRGKGRARSQDSDPRTQISIKATISDGNITNIEEIVAHFEGMKSAMYGEGRLFFSISKNINFDAAKSFGDQWVEKGSYPYGAFARNNNNCSRFITRMLIHSSESYPFWHGINLPETIKASPISNVVNAVKDRMIYSYTPEDGLKHFRMNRWESMLFLAKQLRDNVSHSKSELLPTDQIIGGINFRSKPITLPKDAHYLGGVGDGAWYTLHAREDQYIIKRFTSNGLLEYVVLGRASTEINLSKPFEVTYDSHLLFTHIIQDGRKIRIDHTQRMEDGEFKFQHINELLA